MATKDVFLRPLPCFDSKWLRADLIAALRNSEDMAVLWNNLVQDHELVSIPLKAVVNIFGNLSYAGEDGKHYCGAKLLDCGCCNGYCGESASCNCSSCRLLDSESCTKKAQNQNPISSAATVASDVIFEKWLWGPLPTHDQKTSCLRALLFEHHDICLQVAGSCLSSIHLRQLLCIYERYFIALNRCKKNKTENPPKRNYALEQNSCAFEKPLAKLKKIDSLYSLRDTEKATLGLARVGTRAALNFSFAFLRRAWKSGEDTELCSELLTEALESLQELPEASLFDSTQVSPLWIEVLERSIKFLRQVVLGDVMGGRCAIPREDRHIALSLLLELGAQKGTLGASLEAVVLLLILWDKEKETDDNRDTPHNTGAPLLTILKRYERICNYGMPSKSETLPASATESFLRFLNLPEDEQTNIDIKQAAVVIMSHLDRLAKPHMPTGAISPTSIKTQPPTLSEPQQKQHIFALGWQSLTLENYGFTAEPPIGVTVSNSTAISPLYPAFNLNLPFQIEDMQISEDLILLLTQEHRVFSLPIPHPNLTPLETFDLIDTQIMAISTHCEGRHYMAVDSEGQVYSWGVGDGGRLGHGDTASKETPTVINALTGKDICKIRCGCTYSSALSKSGELYTWGRGSYGRLGHGNSDDKHLPHRVEALKAYKIVDVALGSGDAHMVCATDEGLVFTWGDGDFGKLGNGASCNSSQLPIQVENLPRIQGVFAGSQFSIALSYDGKLYTWGKSIGGRLGHGFEQKTMHSGSEIVNTPKLMQMLEGKIIVDVAVGSAHCLALSNSGEVFGWGRNDCQQICPQSISTEPILVAPILATHPSIRVSGIACGSSHSIVWCQSATQGIESRVPFVIDLSEHTFRLLDQLLGMVTLQDGRQTPSQESECISVACLNLLRLQLHALIVNNCLSKSVGLGEGSRLLVSLKTRILNLAGGSLVLKTIQEAAQWALQVGWSILLPTASERAQTLTSLLPSEPGASTSGHRFMTDLLVGSLMAEGGLETALNQAINSEAEDRMSGGGEHNLPLLHLIKQLLRNNSALTQARLSQLLIDASCNKSDDAYITTSPEQTSPSLDLLHRFQRLLFSHIHQSKIEDVSGAEILLGKYIQSAINLCTISMQRASEIAVQGKDGIVDVLKSDISDTLLNELIVGLIILHRDKPNILPAFEWTKHFIPLLHSLDSLNKLLYDAEVQDSDDMGWPGIICRGTIKSFPVPEEPHIIRKSDLENHILDGGKWIILNGFVYDVKDYQCDNQLTNDIISSGIGKDLTMELSTHVHRPSLEYITMHLKVGKWGQSKHEEKFRDQQSKTLTQLNSERALSYLLGLRVNILQNGTPLQPAELQCKNLLSSDILSGGLQMLQPANPFDEEKGEARSCGSTAGNTPTESSNQIAACEMPHLTLWPHSLINQRVESFLNGLTDARMTDPLITAWMNITERFCKESNLIWHQEFSTEHPVQELERLLAASLIRHQSLGPLVLAVVDRELSGISEKPPVQIAEIIRVVYQTKWKVIRMRQQLNRSYKEVCAPMLERLRFLLYEVRPAVSLEQSGLRNLSILHKWPRFKTAVKRIICEMRIARKQLECAKPEDILNVTIQSQNAAQKNMSQENLSKNLSTENLTNEMSLKVSSVENVASVNKVNRRNVSNENLLEIGSGDSNFITNDKRPPIEDVVKTPTNDFDLGSAKQKTSTEDFINDVVLKLSNKYSLKYGCRGVDGDSCGMSIMLQVVEFVMQEVCDVETLRRAMYCQVQRYQIRKRGLDMLNDLLKISGLLESVQYSMLNGYLSLHMNRAKETFKNILEDLNMVTAFQKATLIIAHSKVLEWAISELQKLVNEEQVLLKQKLHGDKDNSNFGTYVFLKKLSRARFLLSIFGILAKDLGPNELSLLVNSGLLGSVLGLLRQTGGDSVPQRSVANNELSIVFKDMVSKQNSNKTNLSGPELAKLMKIGTRICRGADWKWGDQDGSPPGEGRIISEVGDDGWVRVEWDTGATNSYRMGKENKYDLQLADCASNVVSPDVETEKENVSIETQLSSESHPTRLLRYICTKMLQIVSVGVCLHSDKMEKSAIFGFTSMFRAILSQRTIPVNFCGPDNWMTFGFLRATAGNSRIATEYLSTPVWIQLYMELLNTPVGCELDVYRKVHCLRLLETVLINWKEDDIAECPSLIESIFLFLGKTSLHCPNDLSLIQMTQNPIELKSRVLLSASHSGTVADEVISLLRKLHTLPVWNAAINSFMSEKLCVAADLLSTEDLDVDNLDAEQMFVTGVLNTIGGCDPRPRIGLQVNYEGQRAIICGFTQKGKVLLSTENENTEMKKISISTAEECADHSVFSLSKLPMNEMLLNSWAVILYGPGERRESIPGPVNAILLRSQQIQSAVLNANCVLYRHQIALRKILKQKSPGITNYSSDESFSEQGQVAGANDAKTDKADGNNDSDFPSDETPTRETELLVQTMLVRATQPSPLKAVYTFQELALAALNVTQMLASHVHTELNAPSAATARPLPPPITPTLVHGIPIYNDGGVYDSLTPSSDVSNYPNNPQSSNRSKRSVCPLVSQIMEMGFQKKSIELAMKSLATQSEIPSTADQIVQWILDHPDLCPALASTSGTQSFDTNMEDDGFEVKADNDNDITDSDSSDTVEGCSIQDQIQPTKYLTRNNFQSADQYAMYVRGLVCPGILVKCCRDFDEIKKGDYGTVLKVDTEGLHDLNVQVDWKNHGGTYWVCFVHIELLEPPRDKSATKKNAITIGSQVRIRPEVQTPRYKWGLASHGSVGIVTSVSGEDVTVRFPQQTSWAGCLDEVELLSPARDAANAENSTAPEGDLIDDWSRCLRSLTVSSNESLAKHLLDRTPNCWQSASSSQGKHWIRLELHENVLVHGLSIIVSPSDCSHMPSLIVTRVGDSPNTLKEFSWISIKPTDIVVPLLNDVRQYYQWIEIVIKQCRNNGIQCKVHGIKIIGRRKQTDLDLMLMNAAFLASEHDALCEPSSTASYTYPEDISASDPLCTVLVWGLNDKEQLGGLKGSKVKVPTFSPTLSQLRPIHIAGGSKSLFIVSQDGKVYACGEGTNGRLGLGHNCNVSTPKQVPVISQYVVKKVAVHSGGKHALALTLDGKIFSWGEGEDGKLGHGNRLTLDKPKLIETLRPKRIRDISCGSSHSAAITSSGELYTWGLGEYGRLGHGDNCTQLKPKLVVALLGKRVIQVACGSRDAQTLALTEDGQVYSWGDGDFGKLGRGGSEGSSVPHEIDRLTGVGVMQIECGAQFSLALTKSGEVWTWGKGDYYRLGHGSDQHVRKPAPVQGLRGKKVIHVAVGALHCLAVTDSGQIYAWGDNDHGQQGSGNTTVNKKPTQVVGLDSVFVNRVACGSSHSVAWSMPQSPAEDDKKGPVPFAVKKDPLGGSSLGIYDSENEYPVSVKHSPKMSLSETLLSLETYGARQTALNYVLNAMSIMQARQFIITSLTSHSQICGGGSSEKLASECETQSVLKEVDRTQSSIPVQAANNDVIAQGGGEAPAELADVVQNDAASPDAEVVPAPSGPLSSFHSLTGSLSMSASISSCNGPQRHSKMSASAMSVMAATMTHHDEMVAETHLTGLDDFTSLLGETEAKNLVELLKLSVAGRTGSPITSKTIADTLIALGSNCPSIGSMLLETCITELEDLSTSRHCLGKMPKPVVQETSHPYVDDVTLQGHVRIPGADALLLEFDSNCSTEKRNDPLVIMDGSKRVIATRSGREFAQWAPEIRIPGDEMYWRFTSDSSVNGWGWRFWVHAIMPPSFMQELGSDRAVLSQPSIALVMALLDHRLGPTNTGVLLRLVSALATCAQLNSLTTAQRIWALKKMDSILKSKYAPKPLDPTLTNILMPLIPELLRQYEYEEPQVRGGIHLMHSEYFKTLAALACNMQLDAMLPPGEMHKWAWFRRYCTAVRVAQSLIQRNDLPRSFVVEVRKKLSEMMPSNSTTSGSSLTALTASTVSLSSSTTSNPTPPPPATQSQTVMGVLTLNTSSLTQYIDSVLSTSLHEIEQKNLESSQFLHEDHGLFKTEHDSQLLQWLNRRPEDWALSWGGASTIYGWGHNHRGQLGGLEGSRIKTPTPCEALSLLRPVQLAGGEQTLYAVTPDGKLFATGCGAGGRLGIGGTDSVATPTLVESLQHVFIKKVAVNSGGKHCLALTTDGEVYSWGEGEDGKLGHGNRMSYDRPKLIEALSGIGIVDIACGSAHSACITSTGHVLTWGKGRYGRLGHGDSDDQLRPKLVEALLAYRAIDIACGSGDAQTLCITDDDNVWSWGDGDYGKLGRGGSDGCKIPMKIESLAGLGVVKVECGSQFSVALTRSGAVYTWGKGDYHRLGHGTVDHVRRPKKVAALQGKKIISIATGSLHCVACSDAGEVFTWGDNDEGQLGDGTVTAIQRPRLVTALQGKHIVKVTCGSAHTLALSTSQLSEGARLPPNPPLEYDLVRDLPPEALHARLVLLHHFSELLCPCLSMLPISGELSLSSLKDVLVYSIKEAAFRKVIQTTMVRDKQHGPIIELNRIQVKRCRSKSGGGLAGVDGMKSVFGQMVQKLPLLTQEALSLPHRIWKVKFVGESVDDCGGGYSESIAEMCDELQNGSVPLLIPTPNGRGEAGANRDCFLLDPTLASILQMNMFRFLGVLMGIAVRTGSPLSLNLAEPVWRQLAGENLRPADLTEVDRDYVAGLLCIRDMEDDPPKIFSTLELPFSTSSAKGHEVQLSTRYTRISAQNRREYVRLALNYRLHEFDEQVKAVRDGMSKVIPVPLLSLFSATELQAMVCGSPDIPLGLLKSVATYKGVDPNSPLVQWFWDVMEEFSNQERSLFLRFVWGRTRLPRTIADFRGRDFVLQVLDKYNPPDHFLPESYTCFFLLKMPRYSCKVVLLEKLKYAIHFCKSIDTDEYARVAMGEPTEVTGSEDNSDGDSDGC